MPKLIELNAPQAIALPRETAGTQGGVQAAAIGTLGGQVSSLGRSVMSYQKATANAASAEYRMELRSLQKNIERSTDPAGRMEAFENQTPSIRARVLKKYRFASAPTFDASASLYEGDYRYSLDENAHVEMLQRTDAMQDGIATSISVHAAAETDMEGFNESVEEQFAKWNAQVNDGEILQSRANNLMRSTVSGAITNLSDENPEMAQQVLAKHGTLLTPGQFAQFENTLEAAVGINKEVQIADAVFTGNPDATVPALAALVKEMYTDKDITATERDGIMTRVKSMVSDRETAANRTQQKADTAIIDLVYAADYDNMTPQGKAALRGSIERKPGLSHSGRSTALSVFDAQGVVKTDPSLFGRLWSNPELLGTHGFGLNEVARSMEAGDLKAIQKRHTSALDGTLNSGLVDGVLAKNFKRWGIKNDAKKGSIILQVSAALSGKSPTETNVQDAFNRIYDAGKDAGVWNTDDFNAVPAATIAMAREQHPDVLAVVANSIAARTRTSPGDVELAEGVNRVLGKLAEIRRTSQDAYNVAVANLRRDALVSLDALSELELNDGVLREVVLEHQEDQAREARAAEQERARAEAEAQRKAQEAEAEAQRKAQEAERAKEDRKQIGSTRRLKDRANTLDPPPGIRERFDSDPISGGLMLADDAE